jgi:hypothetical protein
VRRQRPRAGVSPPAPGCGDSAAVLQRHPRATNPCWGRRSHVRWPDCSSTRSRNRSGRAAWPLARPGPRCDTSLREGGTPSAPHSPRHGPAPPSPTRQRRARAQQSGAGTWDARANLMRGTRVLSRRSTSRQRHGRNRPRSSVPRPSTLVQRAVTSGVAGDAVGRRRPLALLVRSRPASAGAE